MFDSIKIYLKQSIDIDGLLHQLVNFGYANVAEVQEEGDFCQRGEVIDIFPITFDWPIRIQFSGNCVEKIRKLLVNGMGIWLVVGLILAYILVMSSQNTEDMSEKSRKDKPRGSQGEMDDRFVDFYDEEDELIEEFLIIDLLDEEENEEEEYKE